MGRRIMLARDFARRKYASGWLVQGLIARNHTILNCGAPQCLTSKATSIREFIQAVTCEGDTIKLANMTELTAITANDKP